MIIQQEIDYEKNWKKEIKNNYKFNIIYLLIIFFINSCTYNKKF